MAVHRSLTLGGYLQADDWTPENAADSALSGNLDWFNHLELPDHIAEGRKYISNNATEVNGYVTSLIDNCDATELQRNPFLVSEIVRYTSKNDPAGALIVAEKYRDLMQKTIAKELEAEDINQLNAERSQKKYFIEKLVNEKRVIEYFITKHYPDSKISTLILNSKDEYAKVFPAWKPMLYIHNEKRADADPKIDKDKTSSFRKIYLWMPVFFVLIGLVFYLFKNQNPRANQ